MESPHTKASLLIQAHVDKVAFPIAGLFTPPTPPLRNRRVARKFWSNTGQSQRGVSSRRSGGSSRRTSTKSRFRSQVCPPALAILPALDNLPAILPALRTLPPPRPRSSCPPPRIRRTAQLVPTRLVCTAQWASLRTPRPVCSSGRASIKSRFRSQVWLAPPPSPEKSACPSQILVKHRSGRFFLPEGWEEERRA